MSNICKTCDQEISWDPKKREALHIRLVCWICTKLSNSYQGGSNNVMIKSALWYQNSTDHNYHIRGIFINTVQGAVGADISLNIYARGTGTLLARGDGGFSYSPSGGIAANVPIKFDFSTGLNATDVNRFKTIDGLL